MYKSYLCRGGVAWPFFATTPSIRLHSEEASNKKHEDFPEEVVQSERPLFVFLESQRSFGTTEKVVK